MFIPNDIDGYVLVTDIGTDANGLYCSTDRSDCCRGSYAPDGVAQGHWYRPDGTQVGNFAQEIQFSSDPTEFENFFSRNRGTGIVRLNRYGNPPERGRFRCEVPNQDGVMVTMYVNIGEYQLWISYNKYEANCSYEATNINEYLLLKVSINKELLCPCKILHCNSC